MVNDHIANDGKKVRLIDANALTKELEFLAKHEDYWKRNTILGVVHTIQHRPTVKAYTAHEVAEILADAFGDTCACNFNGNDEWLPYKCELLDCCPNTYGVACWEQWLKHRNAKDGDGNG